MKALLILLFIFLTHSAWSVCNTPISRTNFGSGQIPSSTKYNLDFNALYDRVNELPGDCFADSSLLTDAFNASAVTTAKIADATLTAAKFASGVIPDYGYPLRIKAYTASGSWLKQADVGRVLVQLVGGGGSTGLSVGAATLSSFGVHCIANPGASNASSSGVVGAGGTATGGDINLTGASGYPNLNQAQNQGVITGTPSMLGPFGMGAYSSRGDKGAGAGGYCLKVIQAAALSDVETVTVGSGGTVLGGTYGTAGNAGLVLVYEYAQ